MKIRMFLLFIFVLIFLTGCISISQPAAHDKSFPPDGRYEILGPIYMVKDTNIIIGLFGFGGIEYVDLLDAAVIKYKLRNAEEIDIVNVSVDKKIILALGVYTGIITTIRGTVIRYINP